MVIHRWQADTAPTPETLGYVFRALGFGLQSIEFPPTAAESHKKGTQRSQPFSEILMLIEGELKITVSSNQLLLRPGDRVEIPANTKCLFENLSSSEPCRAFMAQKIS